VVAQDVTFLGSRGSSDSVDSDSDQPETKKSSKKEVVIEDISDEPIDLSEIPF
jgi:hypothetical protein